MHMCWPRSQRFNRRISRARKHSQGKCTLYLSDLISTVGVILHCFLVEESFIPVQSEWGIIPMSALFMHV